MSLPPLPDHELRRLVELGLSEDLRSGDRTSAACIPPGRRGRGALVAREDLVLAGLEVGLACFFELDPEIEIDCMAEDGDAFEAGTNVAVLEGELRGLLSAERVALNYMQRACGIATQARRLVELVEGTGVRLLDTRKTTPGLRILEKHAVRAGGASNHRFALDDMLMVKDNHVIAAGGLEAAVTAAIEAGGHAHRVEVEVDSLEQLDVLLALPRLPDVVMLDNFSPEQVREGVGRVGGRLSVEVSGGITEENLRSYAEAGPDAISMGALTHSVHSADLAFDLEPLAS